MKKTGTIAGMTIALGMVLAGMALAEERVDLNSLTLDEIIAGAQEEGKVESVGMPDSWANWGLYWQGLTHDLSKYSPTEFKTGIQYFQGNKSPNAAERDEKGYSEAWLHHKGRNKHHYEYWTDVTKDRSLGIVGVKMPLRYVAEMFVDRVSACKIYQKDKYTDRSSWEYYDRTKDYITIHPETRRLLERLIKMLAVKGEDETYRYLRYLLKVKKTY